MTPINGGYHCDYCNDKVLDLTHLSEDELSKWQTENSSACIVMNEPKKETTKLTLSHFALALLIVGGTSLFNFTNAQLAEEVANVEGELNVPKDLSLGVLQVKLVNQHGHASWGDVWVELPNGKELELYELQEGSYYVEIPAYCKGKPLVVYAEHLDKKKHVSIIMYQTSEELIITIKFKSKKWRGRVGKVRGSF